MWVFADRWGARMVGVLLTGRREAWERGSGGAARQAVSVSISSGSPSEPLSGGKSNAACSDGSS